MRFVLPQDNSICLNSGSLLRWYRALLTLGATLLRHTWFLNISLIMEAGSFQEPNRPQVLGLNPHPPKTLIQDYWAAAGIPAPPPNPTWAG